MAIFGFKITGNTNDIQVINGQIAIIRDENVIARNLQSRLSLLKGEWILDTNYGFEYRVILGQRAVDLQALEAAVKTYILATEGVASITLFKFDYTGGEARKLSITFSVVSDLGEIITIEGVTFG